VGILVSANMVEAAPGFVYREIDKVVVKGRHEGLGIHEPVGAIGQVADTQLQELDRWHKALGLYRQQRWEEAQSLLRSLAQAAPETKLYRLYLKRIEHFSENTPGPTWNGLWVFTTK
jgi:adenylate cyclase